MSSQRGFHVPTGNQIGDNNMSAPGCTCACCCRLNTSNTLDSRWLLLRKVLSRLTVQMGITVLLVSIIVFSRPVAGFLTAIPVCLVLYISAVVLPLTVMGHYFRDILDHPVQFFILGLLTAILTFTLALSCSITQGFHIFGTYKEPGCFPTDLIRNSCCCNPLDCGRVKENVFGLGKTFFIVFSSTLCGVMVCLWYQSNCRRAPGASPPESHNTPVPSPSTTENPANTIEQNSAASDELPTVEVQPVQSLSTLENTANTTEQSPSVEVDLQPERLQETQNQSASDESPTIENLFLSCGLGNGVNEAAAGASTEVQSGKEEQKMAGVGELACTYAALILHDDRIPITPERINLIVNAANLKIDRYLPALFTKLLEKRSVEDLILSCGLGSAGEAVAEPSGGGGGGAPAEEEEKCCAD